MLRSAIIFVAHPDDETYLAGGTLALLASQNVRIHAVSATRGEGGELGEPPIATRAEIGRVRERELRCACEALGVEQVGFLGYVDPEIEGEDGLRSFDAPYDRLVAQIYDAIRAAGTELVLTHGSDGEYGHPAHQLMHRATAEAVLRMDRSMLFYSLAALIPGVEGKMWNDSDPAHFALDVRPWLDAKEQAALCHRSQHALFTRAEGIETVRDAMNTVESFRRHAPFVEGPIPNDPFAAVLRAAGAWSPTS